MKASLAAVFVALLVLGCSSDSYGSGYEILEASDRCIEEIETFEPDSSVPNAAMCVIARDDTSTRFLLANVVPGGLSQMDVEILTDPGGWEAIILGDDWYVESSGQRLEDGDQLARRLGGQLVDNQADTS